MDFKLQANQGKTDPNKWDQRKSSGAFQGAEQDFHVKTLLEFRGDEETSDLLINPDRLNEFIKPGDNALMIVNRILDATLANQSEVFKQIAGATLGGHGQVSLDIYGYDND